MSYFTRARSNKIEEITKREQERTIGTTDESRYGQNQPAKDPVVIDRGPAARREQTVGQTAEAMAELSKKLCSACSVIVLNLVTKVAKADPSGSIPIQKADIFGENLGVQRTPDSARPVNLSEALGVGHSPESPQRVALRKKEAAADKIKDACKAFIRL